MTATVKGVAQTFWARLLTVICAAVFLSACNLHSTSNKLSLQTLSLDKKPLLVGPVAKSNFNATKRELDLARKKLGKASNDFGKAADKWLKSMKEPISGRLSLRKLRKEKKIEGPKLDRRAYVRYFGKDFGKDLPETDKHIALITHIASLEMPGSRKSRTWQGVESKAKGKVTPGPVYIVNGKLCRSYKHVVEMAGDRSEVEKIVCRTSKSRWQVVG